MEKNKIFTINGEEVLLSQDQYDHLMSLGIEFSDKWEEDLLNKQEYNILINALFTLDRVSDAWDVIRNHLADIDFQYIFNVKEDSKCPYFQLDRTAQDVYNYMYNENIIDDRSYAYFQVLGGALYDIDFWKDKFDGLSVSQKLMKIYESYNFNNPFDIGLITLDENSLNIVMDGLEDNEKLDDFIIGQHPGVLFDYRTLIDLMINGHLLPENFAQYFGIVLQMMQINSASEYDVVNVYDIMYELYKNNSEFDPGDVTIDTVYKLDAFIKHVNSAAIDDKKYIYSVLVNSIAFMNYPYKYLTGEFSELPNDVLNYLKPKNYPYVLTYKLIPSKLNTDMYITKYPFPAVFNCIYNKTKKIMFVNGEIIGLDDIDNTFEFVYNYPETINDKLMEKCSSSEEYEEVIYSIKDFLKIVDASK